ncbi:hypothetical protein GDO81_023715 [Engystomops pustulosus]|uniref:Secreted protein n=1 Tax=Engystomops pustulosus TaxID=76066 RepID=A0AAV6ZMZ9_ENGPU|nr:hypothetical protein GDO81_023715 [Engystomops pustulosus]
MCHILPQFSFLGLLYLRTAILPHTVTDYEPAHIKKEISLSSLWLLCQHQQQRLVVSSGHHIIYAHRIPLSRCIYLRNRNVQDITDCLEKGMCTKIGRF